MSRQVARTIQEPENKPLFSMQDKIRSIPPNAQVQVTITGDLFRSVLTGKHEVLVSDCQYRVWHTAGTLDYHVSKVTNAYIERGIIYIEVEV